MKVLLDENLPADFRTFLPEHQVSTVGALHWHIQNDERLLERAATFGFDVFVTLDAAPLRIANGTPPPAISVLNLRSATNTLDDLRPLVVPLLEALNAFRPNTVSTIPE
jgi:hypothetical protein